MKEKTIMLLVYLCALIMIIYIGVLACAIFWRGVF